MDSTIVILVFLLLILCIHTRYSYEGYSCPTSTDFEQEQGYELQGSSLLSQNETRRQTSISKIEVREKEITKIKNKSYNDLTSWLLDPTNVITWDNINNQGNRIKITCMKHNQPLKISNIQIWGKGPSDKISRNWAESHPDFGAVSVELSSKEDSPDNEPVYIKKVNQVEGEYDSASKTSVISCPTDSDLIGCSCYSSQGTCNGSEILPKEGKTNGECKAYNRPGGFKVNARAMCAKVSGNLDLNLKKSNESNENSYVTTGCDNINESIISCNCKSGENNVGQACKGANIEASDKYANKFECRAYRNSSSTDSVQAVATCATLTGGSVRSTIQDSDENVSKGGIATSTCNFDEKMIGCNCYAGTASNPNMSKQMSICKGAKFDRDQCIAESVHQNKDNIYPVFADATCAKFNTDGEKCIDNELYVQKDVDGKYTDSSCSTSSTVGKFEHIIINLSQMVFIERIIIYNADYTPTPDQSTKPKLHPVKLEIFTDLNLNIEAIQNRPIDPMIVSTGLPAVPQGVEPDFYTTIDTGLANYYKGWQNIHSEKNKSFCRFLSNNDPNIEGDNVYLSCVNPNTNDINLKSEITSSSGKSFNPGILQTQYMQDETGDNYDDFCRCVPNEDGETSSLLCTKSDPKKQFYEDFYPPDKFLVNDCKTYSGEQLKAMGKQPTYTDCTTNINKSSLNSIDASFYNEVNKRYYIFKNVRFDYTKYVLFCEVDINHNIIEGYPQLVNRRFWGKLPNEFLKQIDETVYGRNKQVYFFSGTKCCTIDLSLKRFKVTSVDIKTLIPSIPNTFSNDIQTGFYLDQIMRLVKRSQFIDITVSESGKLESTESRPLQNLIKIHSEYEDTVRLDFKKIRTILSIYDNSVTDVKVNQWIYIFTDTDVYKYNILTEKFSSDENFNISKTMNELYPTLKWDFPNVLKIMKPTPAVTQ